VFLGHYGAGLAAKRLTPYTSLGTLIVAVQWIDLLWPSALMLGLERVRVAPGDTVVTPLAFEYYPWTHSLAMVLVWAVLVAGAYAFFRRYSRGAWVVGAAIVSHWVLDLVAHRPDLPLWPPDGPEVGLGLWNHVTATVAVELVLFVVGLYLYARSTEPTDGIGRVGLAAFAVVVPVIYLANVFGPPPPNAEMVAVLGQAQWLLVAWTVWIDRHRVAIRQWK
jgi:membrane-bound metal-dependent hydrolase YbcI (DUF457 family)